MIRTLLQLTGAALAIFVLVALPGCGGSSTPATSAPAGSGHYEGDGHDHNSDKTGHSEGDGHDHGKDEHGHEKEGETHQAWTNSRSMGS